MTTVNARGSIQRRLMISLLAGAALLAVALFFIVQSLARQLAEESQDNILLASATSILDASAVRQGELVLDLPYSAFSMLGNLSDDRVFYAVRFGGDFITGYSDLEDVPGIGDARFATRDFLGEPVRVVALSRLLSISGRPATLTVIIAQTRNGQRETLERISSIAAAIGLGFFLAAAGLAALAARSAIRPLERLAVSVGRRGPQDLRPVAAPVPSEMVTLVAALNRFMERLKVSLARSEDFIAEAAHRVRTPLATVRTQADVTLRRVDKEENRAALREMIRAIDESSRAAGQLLDHAMVTFRSDNLEHSALDVGHLAAEMVDRLQPLAELRDIELHLTADDGAMISGDTILIQNALRNLLDNAIKFSPAEDTVSVTVTAQNGEVHLTVRDNGKGFPPEGRDRLTRRFARGSNAEGIVGSGLGLTIAHEVALAHGGRVDIANNSKGPGACVTLSFPSA